MRRRLLCVLLVGLALTGSRVESADPPQKDAPKTDATKKEAPKKDAAKTDAAKPNPAYEKVDDVPNLPRVLLLGDSISIGYTPAVRDMLKGKANVHRPATNCGPTTNGLKGIDSWVEGKWDVIHFNFGLHDLKYMDDKGTIVDVAKGHQQVSLADYEQNLRTLVEKLKKTGAKLIWCTTTPVPVGAKGRIPADVPKYNEAAAKVMKDNDIAVDDLYATALPQLDKIQNKADVHYSSAGYKVLAAQVVASIEKALGK